MFKLIIHSPSINLEGLQALDLRSRLGLTPLSVLRTRNTWQCVEVDVSETVARTFHSLFQHQNKVSVVIPSWERVTAGMMVRDCSYNCLESDGYVKLNPDYQWSTEELYLLLAGKAA